MKKRPIKKQVWCTFLRQYQGIFQYLWSVNPMGDKVIRTVEIPKGYYLQMAFKPRKEGRD